MIRALAEIARDKVVPALRKGLIKGPLETYLPFELVLDIARARVGERADAMRSRAALDALLAGEPMQNVRGMLVQPDQRIGKDLESICDFVLKDFSAEVRRYRNGKAGVLNFLVSRALERAGRGVDPLEVRRLLERMLGG